MVLSKLYTHLSRFKLHNHLNSGSKPLQVNGHKSSKIRLVKDKTSNTFQFSR